MRIRLALGTAAMLLTVAGCASYQDSRAVFVDGSYYSAPEDGYGDYYYGREPSPFRYNPYWSLGGDPFYSFGYCSVRYSYCSPLGYHDSYFGFGGGFGYYGWHDPFWYYPRPYYTYQPRPRPQPPQPPQPGGGGDQVPETPDPVADEVGIPPSNGEVATWRTARRAGRDVLRPDTLGADPRQWRRSIPVAPAPAGNTVRMRYPLRPMPPARPDGRAGEWRAAPPPRPEPIMRERRTHDDSDDSTSSSERRKFVPREQRRRR